MKELIGKSKVTAVLPLLENVAKREGLRLNRSRDFKQARHLLESEIKVNKIVW